MVSGLNHITFSVSDLDRAFAFYKDVLGLPPVARWYKGAHFVAGTQWLCLNLEGEAPAADNSRYDHVAFSIEAEEFESACKRLNHAGVEHWQENHSEGSSFYFLDPDGHKLEIHTTGLRDRVEALRRQPPRGLEIFESNLQGIW